MWGASWWGPDPPRSAAFPFLPALFPGGIQLCPIPILIPIFILIPILLILIPPLAGTKSAPGPSRPPPRLAAGVPAARSSGPGAIPPSHPPGMQGDHPAGGAGPGAPPWWVPAAFSSTVSSLFQLCFSLGC